MILLCKYYDIVMIFSCSNCDPTKCWDSKGILKFDQGICMENCLKSYRELQGNICDITLQAPRYLKTGTRYSLLNCSNVFVFDFIMVICSN